MRILRIFFIEIRLEKEDDQNVFAFDIETPNGTKTIAIANPEVPQVNAIKKELEEFVYAIRHNTQPIVNEIDGYRALEVAHQILQKINYNLVAS